MKIKTFGCKDYTCQLPRIEEGFAKLGHLVVEQDADLVYANNGDYHEAIIEPCDFLILNVLDIPEHLFPHYDIERLRRQLLEADKVTAISDTVSAQVKKYCDIDASVIYNPAKTIYPTEKSYENIKYLYVGRANDSNKRFFLVRDFINQFASPSELVVSGSEDPRFGLYMGVSLDETLNNLYNSVKFVLLPSRFEGIGLSMIEAVLAGVFPIVCGDNPTAHEFLPEFICPPSAEGIAAKIREIEENPLPYLNVIKTKQPLFRQQFSGLEVAKKIINLCP